MNGSWQTTVGRRVITLLGRQTKWCGGVLGEKHGQSMKGRTHDPVIYGCGASSHWRFKLDLNLHSTLLLLEAWLIHPISCAVYMDVLNSGSKVQPSTPNLLC